MKIQWYDILGVKINLLNMTQLNSLVTEAVKLKSKWIIANHNLNSLYLYYHDAQMRDFYQTADYIHIDGMALVWLGKFFRLPCKREHRVTYADWVWFLMSEAAVQGWRVLYLGSKPGIADKGAEILRDKYPSLQIATEHGYFSESVDSLENQAVLSKINSYQPHILMVGMGMPRQERWILNNLAKIEANAILTSGACIDYVAGEVATPPRWMGKVGLEWLYRLATEPKRLWKRYLVEPWFIVWLLFRQFVTNFTNRLFLDRKLNR
ncbi:MAG: WecB/TagA/CpsF family glycosyltransferase [Pleurocapsa sp.]